MAGQGKLRGPRSEKVRRKIAKAIRGQSRSEATRTKMSESRKGIPKAPLSEDTKARMSEAHIGKRHTPETRQKIRDKLLGREMSRETRRRMSSSQSSRDRTYMLRGKHPRARKIRQLTLDGELIRVWDCMRDIIDHPPFKSISCISECCRGVKDSYKGCRWEYAPDDDTEE